MFFEFLGRSSYKQQHEQEAELGPEGSAEEEMIIATEELSLEDKETADQGEDMIRQLLAGSVLESSSAAQQTAASYAQGLDPGEVAGMSTQELKQA